MNLAGPDIDHYHKFYKEIQGSYEKILPEN